ncbi:hypothetical protein FACS1894201_02690 [Bacteroidia bacterium]|nr:hypothetical protein FACS1894201_02690 [Bacteroidia bacterium]
MYIANPIYDVVFRFMMEDNKVAKKFISTIISEEVVELEFAHTEYPTENLTGEIKTVYHMDFVAQITLPNGGYKTVAIELQKAKLPSDIMRFRNYLGYNYQSNANTYDSEQRKARQIYCIFLLNHSIGYPQQPVVEVNQQVRDAATGEVLQSQPNEFIDSLHHRSWIVQIPSLKAHRRNDIERLLSVFDQDAASANDRHIMNVREEDFQDEFRPLIRRLQMAYTTPDVRNFMKEEDFYINDYRDLERKVAEQDKIISEKDAEIATLKELMKQMSK